ncbi:alanine racemase [Isoptericola jiangsuensis]|uniref:alanine racemase n=1 Tax=Isoptericola jiangsuensis TaxID=548579 RepID=UPI003AAF19D0
MRIDDPGRSWPLLTVDREALEHNVATVAAAVSAAGAEHAPHVKTHMSRSIWARQSAAGAWGATVATPGQLRTVRSWGVRRALLANELVDPRDVAWLRAALDAEGLDAEGLDEAWVYVDSVRGVETLAEGVRGAARPDALGVLVELGVPGGRTGLRTRSEVVDLAAVAARAGLRVVGVAGYEGPVAAGTSAEDLAAVRTWCGDLRAAGAQVADLVDGPVVLSAGGSACADVVLGELTRSDGARVVLRSGAYVTHDHGHYRRADPWTRLGTAALRPAITVWASVLSVPEPGMAICGMGRRDVSFDIDLPVPLRARTTDRDGRLGAAREVDAQVTALNDQHAYLSGPGTRDLTVGDVVAFGISHPCTTLDKHRTGLLTDGDDVVEELSFDL